MRLELENFLCYRHRIIDFGDKGQSLLEGRSGTGKTSILKAILFAITGEGKKLVNNTSGSPKCTVIMEHGGIKIKRTKGPVRLLVNDKYEDGAGQEIIDRIFGTTFKTTSFLQQNSTNNFISLPGDKKMDFLEEFAYDIEKVSSIKHKCRDYVSDCNKSLIEVTTELNLYKKNLENTDKPKEVKFPIKSDKDPSKLIKINNHKCNIYSTKLEELAVKYEQVQTELSDVKVLNASTLSFTDQLNKNIEKNKSTRLELNNMEYIGDTELESYTEKLKNYRKYKEFIELSKKYDSDLKEFESMRDAEINSMKQKIEAIQPNLWKEYSKSECEEMIPELKEYYTDMKEYEYLLDKKNSINIEDVDSYTADLKSLETKLEDTRKQLDHLDSSYICPNCNEQLRIVDGVLYTCEYSECETDISPDFLRNEQTRISQSITILHKKISLANIAKDKLSGVNKSIQIITAKYEDISSSSSLKDEIDYLEEYVGKNNNHMKEIDYLTVSIKNEVFSDSFMLFKSNIEKTKVILDGLKCSKALELIDETEVMDIISKQTFIKMKRVELEASISETCRECTRIEEILSNQTAKIIQKYGKLNTEEEINNSKIEIEKSISSTKELKEKSDRIKARIDVWERNQDEIKKYINLEKMVAEYENKELEARKVLSGAELLKKKIVEAGSISIQNQIDTINSHTEPYLNEFFPDDPISAKLSAFKEQKKDRRFVPKINLEIFYKGTETEFESLSGGEQARVILAYTLSLAEIFNSPLLLLDECTASLDQESTNIVFDCIRDNFKGQLAVVVAHQVITGAFDTVIST